MLSKYLTHWKDQVPLRTKPHDKLGPEGEFENEKLLSTLRLSPIRIPTSIPFFNIVINPYILLYLNANGSVTGQISNSVNFTNTSLVGINYSNGSWSDYKEVKDSFGYDLFDFELAGELKVTAEPTFEFRVFNSKKFRGAISTGFYVKGKSTFTNNEQDCNLYAGIDINADAHIKFPPIINADWEGNIYNYEKNIAANLCERNANDTFIEVISGNFTTYKKGKRNKLIVGTFIGSEIDYRYSGPIYFVPREFDPGALLNSIFWSSSIGTGNNGQIELDIDWGNYVPDGIDTLHIDVNTMIKYINDDFDNGNATFTLYREK